MEQGKEPSCSCSAEGERLSPSFHLGDGHPRKEESGGIFQEPRSAAGPVSSGGRGGGTTGMLAQRPAGIIRARYDGLPGMQRYPGRGAEGLERAAEQRL